MENLLALDIRDDYVSGVLLEQAQKVTIVRSYGIATRDGLSLSQAITDVISQTGYREGPCRVGLSAKGCRLRNLNLPFRDPKQVQKVLPFELEELTTFSIADMHLAYLADPSHDGGTQIISAMVDKEELVETLSQLLAAGIDPEIVSISTVPTALGLVSMDEENRDCLLVDIGFQEATLVVVEDGRVRLVRPLALNAEEIADMKLPADCGRVECGHPEKAADLVERLTPLLSQTLLSIGRGELLEKKDTHCFINGPVGLFPRVYDQLSRQLPVDVKPCNIAKRLMLKVEPVTVREWAPALWNSSLALGLWKKHDGPIFDFRSGEFKKRLSLRQLRTNLLPVALAFLVVIGGMVGYLGWGYSRLAGERDRLKQEITAIFTETLPEVGRIVDPVQQLKVKVEESRRLYNTSQGSATTSKLDMLAELSTRIPENLSVRVTRLVCDQDDLRIMAETRDFNTVDNVKRELEKSDMFRSVVISSANLAPRGGEVRFELRLLLR